jgi:hypothetical protein
MLKLLENFAEPVVNFRKELVVLSRLFGSLSLFEGISEEVVASA